MNQDRVQVPTGHIHNVGQKMIVLFCANHPYLPQYQLEIHMNLLLVAMERLA